MKSRKQPFSYDEFKSIYTRVPRLCVDLVIQSKDGILLTLRKRDGWEGLWHFPGSTVYMNESIEDVISRTSMEELGVRLKVVKFLGYCEYHSGKSFQGLGYPVSLVFLCNLIDDEIKLDETASKFEFFKKIPENTIEEVKMFLRQHNLDEK